MRRFKSNSTQFAIFSYFEVLEHRIGLYAAKGRGRKMDIDDLIYGDCDPGPSQR
jgi:hypothetical protein